MCEEGENMSMGEIQRKSNRSWREEKIGAKGVSRTKRLLHPSSGQGPEGESPYNERKWEPTHMLIQPACRSSGGWGTPGSPR